MPASETMSFANQSVCQTFRPTFNQNCQETYWMCSVDEGGPWLLHIAGACQTCGHVFDPAVDYSWQHPGGR